MKHIIDRLDETINSASVCTNCQTLDKRIYALMCDLSISESKIYTRQPKLSLEEIVKRINFILCGPIDNDCDFCNKTHRNLSQIKLDLLH